MRKTVEYEEEWSQLFMALDSIADRMDTLEGLMHLLEEHMRLLESGQEDMCMRMDDTKAVLQQVSDEHADMKRRVDLWDIRRSA